jgi:glycerol uptake facilitator-like aquaporin
MIWATNYVSGGHVNPAISIARCLLKDIHWFNCVMYIVFQLLGATAGAGTISALIPDYAKEQISVTLVNENISLQQAVGVECIITFVLALTVLSCIDTHRGDLTGSAPLSIGLSVTVGALIGVSC